MLNLGSEALLPRVLSSGLTRRRMMFAMAGAVGLSALRYSPPALADQTLNYLGWDTESSDAEFKDWAAQNQVSLQRSFINEDDDIIQKLLAGGLGQYDVCTPDIQHSKGFVERGFFQPIALDDVPSFKDINPFFQKAVTGYAGAAEGTTFIIPNEWGMWALLHRADKVPEPPQSWGDLFDPKYKGKIVLNDDYWAMITLFSRLKGYGSAYPNLTRAQLDDVKSGLIELKKQARTLTPTLADATDLMVRGDAWMAVPGWPAAIKAGNDRGIDIRWSVPKEGTGSWMDNFALVAKAPHRDLGLSFIKYAASEEGQLRHAKDLTGIVNQKAIDKLPADLKSLYPYDDISGFFDRAPFAQVPPLRKSSEDVMTIKDWIAAWEDVKQA